MRIGICCSTCCLYWLCRYRFELMPKSLSNLDRKHAFVSARITIASAIIACFVAGLVTLIQSMGRLIPRVTGKG